MHFVLIRFIENGFKLTPYPHPHPDPNPIPNPNPLGFWLPVATPEEVNRGNAIGNCIISCATPYTIWICIPSHLSMRNLSRIGLPPPCVALQGSHGIQRRAKTNKGERVNCNLFYSSTKERISFSDTQNAEGEREGKMERG